MRGEIEIYSEGNLIYAEDNLCVDGIGETLANLMTVSPQLSSIPSASAILDASSYTVRAISFGKAQQSFLENAHSASGISLVGRASNQIWAIPSSTTTSSYSPNLSLPKAPSPIDRALEIVDLSSILTSNLSSIGFWGQNINLLHYGNIVSGFSLSAAIQYGSYPPASGIPIFLRFDDGSTSGSPVASSIVSPSSTFNQVSSMDWRGFVKLVSGTNPLSGLIVSSTSTFSSTGEVIYQVTIASGDLNVANLYGGITLAGLWGLDIPAMLLSGRTPPYTAHPHTNVLSYKMFNKKSFLKNIASIEDSSGAGIRNYKNLTLVWRLFFL